MKKLIISICFLLAISSFIVSAESNLDLWVFEREIISEENTDYKSIILDEIIYRNSKYDLSDIRIINQKDEFVPYYIENQYWNTTIQDEGYLNYGNQILKFIKDDDTVFDFELIDKEEDKDFIVNELNLDIDMSLDFSKKIIVFGSYDNKIWQEIIEDNIFNITSENKSKTNVYFGESLKYNFYRVVILKNIEDINIENIVAIKREEDQTSLIDYELKKKVKYKIKQEDKKTIVEILNPNFLRVFKIELFTESLFNRNYEMFDSNQNLLIDGTIHSDDNGCILYIDQKQNRLNLDKFNLVIYNKDDKPIDINDIEITYNVDMLTFKTEENGKYRILYGNNIANKPSYDISLYKGNIESSNVEKVKFGNVKEKVVIEEEIKKSIDTKLILNIVVIITSLILIFFIVKSLQKKD